MTLYTKEQEVGGLSVYRGNYGEGILVHTKPLHNEMLKKSTLWIEKSWAIRMAESITYAIAGAWDEEKYTLNERNVIGDIMANLGVEPIIYEGKNELEVGYGRIDEDGMFQYPLPYDAYYKVQKFIDAWVLMREAEEMYEHDKEMRE